MFNIKYLLSRRRSKIKLLFSSFFVCFLFSFSFYCILFFRCIETILACERRPLVDDLLLGEYSALHIAANNDHIECVGILVLLVSSFFLQVLPNVLGCRLTY